MSWLKRIVPFCAYCTGNDLEWLRYRSPILAVPFGTVVAYRHENEYVIDLLVNIKACCSSSIARRLIITGAVEINGKTIDSLSERTYFCDTKLKVKVKKKIFNVLLK